MGNWPKLNWLAGFQPSTVPPPRTGAQLRWHLVPEWCRTSQWRAASRAAQCFVPRFGRSVHFGWWKTTWCGGLRLTLQGINISHLKGSSENHRLKMQFFGDMLVPWRVVNFMFFFFCGRFFWKQVVWRFFKMLVEVGNVWDVKIGWGLVNWPGLCETGCSVPSHYCLSESFICAWDHCNCQWQSKIPRGPAQNIAIQKLLLCQDTILIGNPPPSVTLSPNRGVTSK